MTLRARRALFYILVVVFFVIGAGVILYAQGWRFDLSTWRPKKVGGIFVRSYPEDAAIALDGKPVANEAGILSHGTIIDDLFPKSYLLSLSETGYDAWRENVSVFPALVTELKDAVLVPQTPTTIASGTVAGFSIVSGETILQAPDGTISWRGVIIGKGVIASESATFKNVMIKNATTGVYTLYDFDEVSSTNLSAALAESGVNAKSLTSFLIDPYDDTKIIAGDPKKILIFDTAEGLFAPVGQAVVGTALGPSLAPSPSLLAWTSFSEASGTSAVGLYDTFAKTTTISSTTVSGRTTMLHWISSQNLGVLQDDGSLYIHNTANGQFQKLADDVLSFAATPDGSMIAAVEQSSLEIFSFTDAGTYHRFNLPGVSRVIWYSDMDHLFIVYPNRVAFLDLEDAGLNNLTTVAQGTAPFYDALTNELSLITPTHQLVQFTFPN